jgi:hypothetical protein
MIGVMTTASTKPEAAAADAQRAAARVASEALAAQLVRQAAARWPTTSDQVTILGRELAGSIDRYEQVHHQAPTWADALADVDPALLAPLQVVPDEWPHKPSRWRLALRQQLMIELRRTRWITYTRTTRSLQPGKQGRGWLRTARPTPVVPTPHAVTETGQADRRPGPSPSPAHPAGSHAKPWTSPPRWRLRPGRDHGTTGRDPRGMSVGNLPAGSIHRSAAHRPAAATCACCRARCAAPRHLPLQYLAGRPRSEPPPWDSVAAPPAHNGRGPESPTFVTLCARGSKEFRRWTARLPPQTSHPTRQLRH